MFTNVVPKETLRKVQLETMDMLKESLKPSFGPFGSNSIIKKDKGLSRYTKDGHTILSSIQVAGEIEQSVIEDIEEETRTQAIKIGDSTTSITILSSLIFKSLAEFEKDTSLTPATIVSKFKEVTEEICDEIKTHAQPATVDNMYDIAYISTNGNKNLSEELKNIYKEYGLDVYIDVKASMNGTTYLKELNGMTMDCGFLDPTLINDPDKNTCVINNPRIYAFKDPIDTMEMGTFLDAILYNNIVKPVKEQNPNDLVPTVILAPKLSRDYSAYIDSLMQTLASLPSASRGWLNIITNIAGCDMEQFEDICDLCGCKYIKKYLDLDIQASDIEKGLAPTPETVCEFYGTAKQVVSDANKTSFIEPKEMYDESGNSTPVFEQRIDYLEKQIKKLEVEGNNTTDIYTLKKRLHSLKGKMVEIYIGGVSVADRDAERDLMEDAVLNCRSASVSGVGYAANFEGYRAAHKILSKYRTVLERGKADSQYKEHICRIIDNAYEDIMTILYTTTGKDDDSVHEIICNSLANDCPLNITTGQFDGKVLTSIDTDICTLNTISKIITIMATANQFILPTVNINKY